MNDCYSPHTGEHIQTNSPAPWMGRAVTPAPAYDRATEGCFWRGAAWEIVSAPDPMPEMMAAKLAEINAAYERDMSAVKDGYPPSEILSWDKQEREARAYRTDANASTPFIDALAGQRQIAKPELVDRIVAKVESFETVVGALTGKRQRLEDQISSATTEAELALIVW